MTTTATKKAPAKKTAAEALDARKAAKERRHLAKVEAETRKLVAEAEEAEARARQYKLEADAAQLDWDQRMASDYHHGIFHFDQAVTAGHCKQMQAALTQFDRRFPDKPITLALNSPGGSVFDGMALFDYLTSLKKRHHLTTLCRGYAGSMASILMQAGHDRVMGAESYQVVHEISFAAFGKPGDVEDSVEWADKITKRVLRLYAERSTLNERQIAARWKRKDWTLDAAECVELGFADRIG